MISEIILDQVAKTIKYVRPAPLRSAGALAEEVYRQMQYEFLPVPLVTLQSPAPQIMAGVWSILRETLLAGSADRTLKETVAAVVSKTNECPYCIESHAIMLHAAADHDTASAIMQGAPERIQDQRLRAAVAWMQAHQTAGAPLLLPSPFSQADLPEIIGTAVAFHYINRMVNVFLGETLLPLPQVLKTPTHRLYAALEGQRVVTSLRAGASLRLLPDAPLPDDLAWAAGSPAVAGAFARFARVVDEAGSAALPDAVRTLVYERIHAWDGHPVSLGRHWVEDAIGPLAPAQRASARLALLSALASYQVDQSVIDQFRAAHPTDTELIAVTAWASFTAARRAGEWLWEPSALMETLS